jgi:hypothetical protein
VEKQGYTMWFVHEMGGFVDKWRLGNVGLNSELKWDEIVGAARREDSPSGMLLPGPTVRSIRRPFMSDAVPFQGFRSSMKIVSNRGWQSLERHLIHVKGILVWMRCHSWVGIQTKNSSR